RTDWGSSSRASKLFGIAGGLISMVLHYYSSFPFCQPHHLNAYTATSGEMGRLADRVSKFRTYELSTYELKTLKISTSKPSQ
ncbi:hypothetical protein, partial [Moorena sp. SIO3I6]|uniref:hypothetical protein n=1 Tax=Moorena sp. SIO3I6 TaxID=2607831 RepID=UPI0025CC630A